MEMSFQSADVVANTEVIIYPLCKEAPQISALEGYALPESALKPMKVTWLYQPEGKRAIVCIGLGDKERINAEYFRQAAGTVGRAIEQEKVTSVKVDFSGLPIKVDPSLYGAWVEGWELGTYTFDQYKREKRKKSVQEMVFIAEETNAIREAVNAAKRRAEGTILARNLGNKAPNDLRPLMLADEVKQHFASTDVEVNIYTGEALEQMQMNGLIAVGKGSEHPPAFIEMRYCTDPSLPLIALVGKGITFDTGGISLKKARDLSDMRLDMAGAAAVIGAMEIIVSSGQNVNVAALIASAENAPDGGSMLPGEVITYKNGLSVQVGNTDAEGRLVLADALIRAGELGAVEVVDIATLTGACMVALGDRIAGLWGTDEQLIEQLKRAAQQTGDQVWPMPLAEEYEDLLKSVYADVSNISKGPYAGAITAALFLKKFAPRESSWAHIDMAGPMEAARTGGYTPAGATGFGARLLSEYVLKRK